MLRAIRMLAVGPALAGVAGCTIADVTIPPSEDRLVVEAVLRTDARTQSIVLHRAVRGGVAAGEAGAEVVVTRGDGLRVVFRQSATDDCYRVDPRYLLPDDRVEIRGTCYLSDSTAAAWVLPGRTYELDVRTTRGEAAHGRTTVPGDFSLRGMDAERMNTLDAFPCWLAPHTSFTLTWTPAEGAWGYLAPLQIVGLRVVLPDSFRAPDPLELMGVSVSGRDTTLLLPTEFGVFDRFTYDQDLMRLLQGGLPPGVRARLVVAAADRNYINGVRGGSFNPSGVTRISSIVGDAVGVFGSLVPLHALIIVDDRSGGLPACGSWPPVSLPTPVSG